MAETYGEMVSYAGEDGQVEAYQVLPAREGRRPAVIVIHEIYGLTDHIKDVADRFAKIGYVAFAPHLYSRKSLAGIMTKENVGDMIEFLKTVDRSRMVDRGYIDAEIAKAPQEKRDALQKIFTLMYGGGMPKDGLTLDLVNAAEYLKTQNFVEPGKIASIGFCFGGGMSLNLACRSELAAAVVFYGENPDPIEKVENIRCPVLGLYGAQDSRINIRLDELVKAMVRYQKDFEMRIYPDAAHAFFNDTNKTTYRQEAARDAWERVLRFFARTLFI